MTIRYLHFCGGFGQQAEQPLRHWELVAIRAAAALHPDATVLLHTQRGSWANAPGDAELVTYDEAERSQWATWTAKHGAHQSDRVRLLALLKYGGLYQDTDSFMLRNCDHLSSVTGAALPSLNSGKRLSNAFMWASTPSDGWLSEAYERISNYCGSRVSWDYTSCRLYGTMRQLPGVTVLPWQQYLTLSYSQRDQHSLFGQATPELLQRLSEAYVCHALAYKLSYAAKTALMGNPPPGSLYEHVLGLSVSNIAGTVTNGTN